MYGFKFVFYDSSRVLVMGSLHKFKNSGRGNYDDFSVQELSECLNDLSSLFDLDWLKLKLVNVEYGVNITPPVPSKQIIDGLLFYKSEEFKNIKQFSSGRFKKVDLQRFSIKCYDKRIQFPDEVKDETLRFEIHVRKMEYLNRFGIRYMEDLLRPERVAMLGVDLTAKWNNILLFDFSLDPGQNSQLYYQWSNPKFWRNLREQYGVRNRTRIMKEITKLDEFLTLNGCHAKADISRLISNKWNLLTDCNERLLQLHG